MKELLQEVRGTIFDVQEVFGATVLHGHQIEVKVGLTVSSKTPIVFAHKKNIS